jgi:hypothetical protein
MEEPAQHVDALEGGVNRLMQEETEKVIHHISAALPGELAESLSQSGELKEKLLGYFERNVHAMAGAYAPKGIAELLEPAGGAVPSTAAEVEKSLGNMYGHLQGHIQRGIRELENQTNSLLRQNTGAFIRGDKAYTVVKSAFRDNPERPKTVTDLKLCVNIPESALITPIFHYQVTAEYLIKDILSKNITLALNSEIEKLRDERLDEGLEELTDAEILISKLRILDRLKEQGAETESAENLKRITDIEYIRDRGFNIAVNSLSTILDNSRLGFQFIENFKNARELLIREYDDTESLPDEHYRIRMRYFDAAQLEAERRAYDVQMRSFETEILRVRDILQVYYEAGKSPFRVNDFKDLILQTRERTRKRNKGKTGGPLYEDMDKPWDGISFVKPGETDVERMNRTYAYEKERITQGIKVMREMIQGIYGSYRYPPERRSLEDRLNFLEKEYTRFDYRINPYHVQPGLTLDVDLTSIKRRRITLDAMSRALNEFLQSISRGFQETAFSTTGSSFPAAPDGQSFGDLLSSVSGDTDKGIREI